MKVLITGATGLIGKVLIEKFFSTGAKVNFLTTKKSKIHSSGVFATKDINKNTRIIEYVGEKVKKSEEIKDTLQKK